MKIYKYLFQPEITMPKGAQILTIQPQGHHIQMWALVDPTKDLEKRKFIVFGTGAEVPPNNFNYITTLQEANGALIWHYFEILA